MQDLTDATRRLHEEVAERVQTEMTLRATQGELVQAAKMATLGQIATGQVDVADDHVRVQVVLPWLLQRFAEMAQATIRKRGQLLLTKDDGK